MQVYGQEPFTVSTGQVSRTVVKRVQEHLFFDCPWNKCVPGKGWTLPCVPCKFTTGLSQHGSQFTVIAGTLQSNLKTVPLLTWKYGCISGLPVNFNFIWVTTEKPRSWWENTLIVWASVICRLPEKKMEQEEKESASITRSKRSMWVGKTNRPKEKQSPSLMDLSRPFTDIASYYGQVWVQCNNWDPAFVLNCLYIYSVLGTNKPRM